MKTVSRYLAGAAMLSSVVSIAGIAMVSVASAQTPEIVETMRTLSGKQKARPSGAKGQCLTGSFAPTLEAKALSKSPLFAKVSPVVARLSVGGGNAKVMDANKAVNRGFAMRLDPGGDGQSEFVMVNAPINFVKSPQQMLAFLQARLPGADGKPDPEKIKAFTDANPETTAQGRYLASKPVVGSWVGVNYWAIHPYTLTNAAGAKQLVKFKMVPLSGEVGLSEDEAKAKPADFLADELKDRLATQKPAGFEMVAILGRAGDETTNATQMWDGEETRPTVKLGTLTIAAFEKNETCDTAIFDPVTLADGIAGPDDELFLQRQPAYAISISERL